VGWPLAFDFSSIQNPSPLKEWWWVFYCLWNLRMKPPFDIAADLDTPVSAYLKLAPFGPKFLLESVEGGVRLARYSFIGFGDCLEVKVEAGGVTVGGVRSPRPGNKQEFLNVLRTALAQAPKPQP